MQDISLVWTRKEVESLARAGGSWRAGQGVGGQRGKSSVLGGAPGACCQGLNELQPPGKGRAASTETSGCESLLSMYSCCQIGKEDLGKNGIKNIAESIIMPAHKSGLQSCLEQCVRS